jgi:GTP:adenosylcobinamide-phosphate guanylyltransferase
MARAAQYFTMDAITKVAYGKEFGFCATDSDVHEAIQRAEESIPFLVLMAEMPLVGRLFINKIALKLLGPKTTDKKGMGKMLG